jgi:hypothetical protein
MANDEALLGYEQPQTTLGRPHYLAAHFQGAAA